MSDVSAASSLLAAGGLLAAAAAAANAGVSVPQVSGSGPPTVNGSNSGDNSDPAAAATVAAAAAAAAMTRLNWERYQRAAAAIRYSPYNLHPSASALGPTTSLPGLCLRASKTCVVCHHIRCVTSTEFISE